MRQPGCRRCFVISLIERMRRSELDVSWALYEQFDFLGELCMSGDKFFVTMNGLPVHETALRGAAAAVGVCDFARSFIVIGSYCSIAIATASIGSRDSSTSN